MEQYHCLECGKEIVHNRLGLCRLCAACLGLEYAAAPVLDAPTPVESLPSSFPVRESCQ